MVHHHLLHIEGTSSKFQPLLNKKEILRIVTIDEAHKIFDRMPDYRTAFDAMKQLKELGCPILAMSNNTYRRSNSKTICEVHIIVLF